ncbi:MAG: hypothetical protein BJ554DRAFT_2588 [Olpidium bornovanus]|uniref:Uncharacterized protein n=1 Tax=Olpidium bornovanus TaxID=278681 RepID=A0A8H7ZQ77_9FUNG|nr:MAG: hypothetical protein BJ554DRAFT_2588 [Olpidium bornovanus]
MAEPHAARLSDAEPRQDGVVKVWPRARHQDDPEYGPCPRGGSHRVRWHSTKTSLLFAFMVWPYCCGYRGKKRLVCTKCKGKMSPVQAPATPGNTSPPPAQHPPYADTSANNLPQN